MQFQSSSVVRIVNSHIYVPMYKTLFIPIVIYEHQGIDNCVTLKHLTTWQFAGIWKDGYDHDDRV